MDPIFWQQLSSQALSIDQSGQPLDINRAQVEKFYLPIADWLWPRSDAFHRQMIAVAGPPGAGKSSFCAILAGVVNARASAEIAVVVGLDGWHYPNAYLLSHTAVIDEQTVTLRSIKGRPETYDAAAMGAALEQMRAGGQVKYPLYSRITHDPIPNAGQVSAHHRLVLVEGNYLLLNRPPWDALLPLFHRSILVRLSGAPLEESLRARHARGGKDAAAILRQLDVVDLPDTRLVLSSSVIPDLLVEKSDSRQIAALHFNP